MWLVAALALSSITITCSALIDSCLISLPIPTLLTALTAMTAGHHLVIITGANRGFGASVAHTYLDNSNASAVSYVLVGRSQDGLQKVLDGLKQKGTTSNIAVNGLVVANVDLADTTTLDTNLARIQEASKQLRDESIQAKVLCNKRERERPPRARFSMKRVSTYTAVFSPCNRCQRF